MNCNWGNKKEIRMTRQALSVALTLAGLLLLSGAVNALGLDEIFMDMDTASYIDVRTEASYEAQASVKPVYPNSPSSLPDYKTFEGYFIPASNSTSVAIFSDDGVDFYINGTCVLDNKDKGQALPNLDIGASPSLIALSRSWVGGKVYHLVIDYSNTCYSGQYDIDGCTLFAYNGGGDICDSYVDLLSDSNNDGSIDDSDQSVEADSPSGYIIYNVDDDNSNTIQDRYETGTVTGEDDLVQVNLAYGPSSDINGQKITLVASTGSDNIKVWTTSSKGTQIPVSGTGTTYVIGTDSIPSSVYVEGVATGEATLDAVMQLSDGTEVMRDNVKFTVCEYIPMTCSVTAESGALYAQESSVTLALSAGSSAAQMHFSNDGSVWSTWEDYASSKEWTLASGDGEKTVYAQFEDSAGHMSAIVSDKIYLRVGQKILHVDAKAGNDYNYGFEWGTAKATIGGAIESAIAGDQIWVKGYSDATVYNESITLDNAESLYGGFDGTETTLAGRSQDSSIVTIIDGSGIGTSIGDGLYINILGVVVTAGSDITSATTIDGFTIQNGSSGISCESSALTISNNRIISNDGQVIANTHMPCSGISCADSSPVISGNMIGNNFGCGVSCSDASPTIINCMIYGNHGSTFYVSGIECSGTSNPTIVNNTIAGNSGTLITGGNSIGGGISLGSCSATIRNNIIAFNGGGISGGASSTVIGYNCVYGNGSDASYNYYDVTASHSTDISGDPLFVNSSNQDYHLQTVNSPCFNAGNSDYSNENWTDIDGEEREQGDSVDMGADEFTCNWTTPKVVSVTSTASDGLHNTVGEILDIQVQFDQTVVVTGIPTLNLALTSSDRMASYYSGSNSDTLVFHYTIESGDNSSDLDYLSTTSLAGTIELPNGADADLTLPTPGAYNSISDDKNIVIRTTVTTGTRYYVSYHNNSRGNCNDGKSWSTAFKTIQGALNVATSGSEVWVKYGTYRERITLPSGVKLYGSFRGTETVLSARPVFPRSSTEYDTKIYLLSFGSYGSAVTIAAGASSGTLIDGFNIWHGYSRSAYGGGIYCGTNSQPTISNNSLISNGSNSRGGGIYCDQGSSVTISSNYIGDATGVSGNCAQYGSGIYCYKCTGTISNNTIVNNDCYISNSTGGGIYLDQADMTVTGNTITGHYVHTGGGGIYVTGCTNNLQITSNVIEDNSCDYYGGGIYVEESYGNIQNNNLIRKNEAEYGGGIALKYADVTISGNTIGGSDGTTSLGNYAEHGGGIYVYDNMSSSTRATISNNDILNNIAQPRLHSSGGYVSSSYMLEAGAGIYSYNADRLVISYNTIANNEGRYYGGTSGCAVKGGGIYMAGGSSVQINNNSIHDNEANYFGDQLGEGAGAYLISSISVTLTGTMYDNTIYNNDRGGLYVPGSGLVINDKDSTHIHDNVGYDWRY
ncbi:MAG: right-handed parallel beta-helix repeat-containing protein [Armatimonadota bacterium]|nr:right-handed parallel beta-helix repeat-containing protein [bacterium]